MRPPSQTEPPRGAASRTAIVSPRGEVCAGVAGRAGDDEHRGGGQQRAGRRAGARRSTGARARDDRPTGRPRRRCRTARTRPRGRRSRARTPSRGYSGTSAPSVEHRSQRVVCDRDVQVHRDRDQAEHRRHDATPPTRARRLVPGTRRRIGRAISTRSTNSPIAAITRQEHHPASDQQLRRRRPSPRSSEPGTAAPARGSARPRT